LSFEKEIEGCYVDNWNRQSVVGAIKTKRRISGAGRKESGGRFQYINTQMAQEVTLKLLKS
jgi:hypothetical protein